MGILDWLFSRNDGDSGADQDIDAAVESLVDAMDSRLRLVDGYQKKLRTAVRQARAALDALLVAIPGPLDFSHAGWGQDALVKALFASPREMAHLFSAEPVVQEFFAAPENREAEACCVALFATLTTRKTLGFAMQGDMIQSDVVREAVSFTAHRLTRPAATGAGVIAGLQEAGLHYLAGQALQGLADSRSHRQMLEEERDLLKLRIDASAHRGHALENLLSGEAPGEMEEAKLAELERRLEQQSAMPRTLDEHLVRLQSVLQNVPGYIRMEHRELCLDNMNVLTGGDDGHAVRIPLCQVQADGHPPRTVVIARFPRAELLPKEALEKRALML